MDDDRRLPDLQAALRLFDETTGALAGQVRRLEEVLTAKQAELVATNRTLAEKVGELDHLTRRLNLVLASVASGVVAVDREGMVTTCNEAACTALAGVLPDPVGADWEESFPDSPLLETLADGRPRAYERRLVQRGGAPRILACRSSALRDAQGSSLGAVEIFEDVSEMRRLQEAAERADRLKRLGEMAAGVAHEIRNPLNGIEGFASLLARDLPADDRRHRYAQAVISGVRDLNRTVSGLLEFTRPRRLERRPCDPLALAEACLGLLRAEIDGREAGSPPVALDATLRWPGGALDLDAAQLKQVLVNLLQNALHAVSEDRPEGGRIVLGLDAVEGGARFSVEDDGPGIPEDERARLFTPFHSTRAQGTGLGLAISQSIVQLHGGSIGVDASPLGGARFRVVLPG